jgi:hypothetical protein
VAEIDFTLWATPAVGVLLITSLVLLASRDWRWTISALSLQYAAVFVLVAGVWRLDLVVVKLVAGWMSTAILAATQDSIKPDQDKGSPSEVLFRVLLGAMVALVVFSIAEDVAIILETYLRTVAVAHVAGGLLLIGMGLALLGLTAQPLRVAMALLVFFTGFEIIYAMVEDATLVAGLLAVVNLSLASIGAYLHTSPSLERVGGVE